MKFLARAFTPTDNRRLNELVGFLLLVAAALLSLALVSYSPLDPSLNTAGFGVTHGSRNWIGVFGSSIADIFLQTFGVIALIIPVPVVFLSIRWFRSRRVEEPVAKAVGAALL